MGISLMARVTIPSLRVAFAALGLIALGVGYDRDLHTHDGVNFFFYFTDLSNLLAAGVLLAGGTAALRGRRGVPELLRGASVLYLVITGLVYWSLLAGQMTAATIKWQNDIVHGVMPAVLLLDWLLVPPTARIGAARASRWLVFPLLYLAVSLVRGPFVRWWPYDFLDPREPGGYTHVATWSVIVTVVFVLFTALITAAGNRLGARRYSGFSPDAGDAASASSDGSPSAERNLSTRSA